MTTEGASGEVLVVGRPTDLVDAVVGALVRAGRHPVRLDGGVPDRLPEAVMAIAVLSEPTGPRSAILVVAGPEGSAEALEWLDAIAAKTPGPGAVIVVGPSARGPNRPGRDRGAEFGAGLEVWVRSAAVARAPRLRVIGVAATVGSLSTANVVEEIAAAAAFLVGDGARFVTGTTIPVDGGAHLSWRLGRDDR